MSEALHVLDFLEANFLWKQFRFGIIGRQFFFKLFKKIVLSQICMHKFCIIYKFNVNT